MFTQNENRAPLVQTVVIFLHGLPWWSFCIYRGSIFTLFSLIIRDKISSRFNELKFQHGLKISIWAAPKIEVFAETVNYFCKRLHLRCLNGCRMCHGCVSDNYLSVSLPTQPYLLLFLFSLVIQSFVFFKFPIFPWNSYTCTTTGNNMVLECLVTSSNLTLHNRGTASIGHKIKH